MDTAGCRTFVGKLEYDDNDTVEGLTLLSLPVIFITAFLVALSGALAPGPLLTNVTNIKSKNTDPAYS